MSKELLVACYAEVSLMYLSSLCATIQIMRFSDRRYSNERSRSNGPRYLAAVAIRTIWRIQHDLSESDRRHLDT